MDGKISNILTFFRTTMANLKLYTEEFIHDRQASVREARDRAKAKKEKGQKLTPAKQELAESY